MTVPLPLSLLLPRDRVRADGVLADSVRADRMLAERVLAERMRVIASAAYVVAGARPYTTLVANPPFQRLIRLRS
jgi:hypothetical protein